MARGRVRLDKIKSSIVFEPNAADGTEVTDRLEKWCSLKSNILVSIIENRYAVIRCCVSKESDFQLSKVIQSACVKMHSREGRGGFIYSSATCPSFSVEDFTELASTMEFELAQLWIQITAADLSNKSSAIDKEQDPEKFFEAIGKVVLGETDYIDDIECIGNVADGYIMVWFNPPTGGVERLTKNLRKWCQALGFDLTIAD